MTYLRENTDINTAQNCLSTATIANITPHKLEILYKISQRENNPEFNKTLKSFSTKLGNRTYLLTQKDLRISAA